MLTVALSKGRLLKDFIKFIDSNGNSKWVEALNNRERKLQIQSEDVRFILVKGQDVSTYVEQGIADIGITGSDILDEKDYIKAQYYLEISSPGLERNLRRDEQFLDNINKKIEVHLYNSINNKKIITGILQEYTNDYLIIDNIKIENSNIASAKTIYNWEEC